MLATSATVVIRCTNCGSQHTRQGDGYAIDMLYTPQVRINLRARREALTEFGGYGSELESPEAIIFEDSQVEC